MSANATNIASVPLAPRQTWARLWLLTALLATAFALVVFVIAWLVPVGPHSWSVEYPLANLEVGVPHRFEPVELGRDAAGRLTWIWLVRQPDGRVSAFWSRTAHPSDCSVAARRLTPGNDLFSTYRSLASSETELWPPYTMFRKHIRARRTANLWTRGARPRRLPHERRW